MTADHRHRRSIPGSLAALLSGPVAAILDGAVRELAAELIDARGPVTRAELAAVADRLERARAGLAAVQADVAALRQAAEGRHLDDGGGSAMGEALGIDDPARATESAAARRIETSRRLGRLLGALAVTDEQVRDLERRLSPTARA